MTYNTGVRRASLFMLLVGSVLLAGSLQAQRGGGAGRGGSGLGGHAGFRQGHSGGRNLRNNFRNNGRNNGLVYPFWDDQPFWGDEPAQDEQMEPPAMLMQPGQFRSVSRTAPAPNPKVIELPGNANPAASPLRPSAIFILDNGERLETRQYLLTHDHLFLTIDRNQRTIPIDKLDIKATTAANVERGIDLRIPADRNEISLSF